MAVAAVICEYNPFHLGHLRQFAQLRERLGESVSIVCLMSGNFVQRGEPAVFDKRVRAGAAALCGADLVLELPVTGALSSAEGFAACGVRILSALGGVDTLAFGCESGDINLIMSTATSLLRPDFQDKLLSQLKTGISYAAAREQALTSPEQRACLRRPNDILATEYCKALLSQHSPLRPLALPRSGDYLAALPRPEEPSALSLRLAMQRSEPWLHCVPSAVRELYASATEHALSYGERAVLARLRTMRDADFEALPFGSEGLWRRLMHAARSEATVEGILAAAKTKRYAHSRLQRMLLCATLGITNRQLLQPPAYVRVLAFSDGGRALLKRLRASTQLPVIDAGEKPSDREYFALECRCADLYTLFSRGQAETGCRNEEKIRNFYAQNEKNTCK